MGPGQDERPASRWLRRGPSCAFRGTVCIAWPTSLNDPCRLVRQGSNHAKCVVLRMHSTRRSTPSSLSPTAAD